jgi:hypothetical protein
MELIYIFWLFLAFLGSAIFANAIKYWDHLDDSAREAAKAPEAFGYAIGKILKFTFSVLFRLIRLSGPTQFKQLEKREPEEFSVRPIIVTPLELQQMRNKNLSIRSSQRMPVQIEYPQQSK